MTLIVGIKSKEGIVLAADGAATLGSMGNRTVIQSVKKLSTIQDKIIVGVSGSVGLSQRINGVVDKLVHLKSLLRKVENPTSYEYIISATEMTAIIHLLDSILDELGRTKTIDKVGS